MNYSLDTWVNIILALLALITAIVAIPGKNYDDSKDDAADDLNTENPRTVVSRIKPKGWVTIMLIIATFLMAVQRERLSFSRVQIESEKAKREREKAEKLHASVQELVLGKLGRELMEALREKNGELAETLINRGAPAHYREATGITPLHLAASNDLNVVVSLLLARGADVQAVDKGGNTPLHFAKGETVAALLITNRAAMDATNLNSQQPLHVMAAAYNSHGSVAYLSQQKVDINARDNQGKTPLHYAQLGVMHILVRAGANVNAKDKWGYTPLMYQFGRYDATVQRVTRILELGGSITETNNEGANVFHAIAKSAPEDVSEELIALVKSQAKSMVNLRDGSGNTPLHWAAKYLNSKTVKALVEVGADVNIQDQAGKTCLELLDHPWTSDHQDEASKIRDYLLKHKARLKR